MARTIYQNRPVSDKPDTAVGISLPFNKSSINGNFDRTALKDDSNTEGRQYNEQKGGASVFALNYTTHAQSISNLRNLLGTVKGERYMQPRFGTDLRKAIFEPNTSAFSDIVEERLIEDIKFWLPYFIIDGVIITRDINAYSLSVSLVFRLDVNSANLTINVLLDENAIVVSDAAASTPDQLELVGVGSFGSSTIVPNIGGSY